MSYNIHFITYGDDKYKQSRERICNEAKDSNWFNQVKYFTNNDYDTDFYNKYKQILDLPRGGGYWIWKPYFIKTYLDKLNDNDILVYIDSGCSINKNNKNEFDRYIEIVKNHTTGILGFQYTNLFYQEKKWNIQEVFDYFNVKDNTDILDSPQICGGIQIIHKKTKSIEIINKWYNVIENNILLFTDNYSKKQKEYFRDHRHDQSIQSVIKKIYNVPIIQNHGIDSMNGIDPKNNSAPFTASRIRC